MDLSCGPAAVAMQAAPLHASLLAHVPGVVTSIRIPEGFGETLEFNYTDIRNALIPPSAYSEPAPKALQLHVGDTVPFPIEPPRGSAVKGRYDNIIEQLERKYCGSRTAAVVDDMEDSPKKKSRQKRAASIVNEGADGEEEEDGRSNDDYYDSEDSFIDDSAADRDIQFAFNMRNVQTKRSGFFVSAGELEVTAPAKSSKSMAVQEIDFDPDTVDAEPERNQKSPSKSSQSAMQAIRKLIRRRMIELSPKRFPSEIAAEIGRAVELCRRSSDYRWAIRELTDILQPTHLSSGRIKKHIQESAAGARMKEDIKKKKGEGKMEQSVELIIAMLEVKVKLFVVEGSDIEASSFINRAMAATTESLSSEDVLASVDALADAYMKIWASLWENFELRSTLQNFQDVCKKWAISEALDRISKKAVMKAAAEPGPDAAAAGAEDGHVSAQPPLLDLTKAVADGSQSQSETLLDLDAGARESLETRAKMLFSHQIRKWLPGICRHGFEMIRRACTGAPSSSAESAAATVASRPSPTDSVDDDKLITGRFLAHLKKLQKKRDMNWGPIIAGRKRIQSIEMGGINEETKPNLEVVNQESIPKKKIPKRRIILPPDPSATPKEIPEGIVVPPVMLRTPSGMSSPVGAPVASAGKSTEVVKKLSAAPKPQRQIQVLRPVLSKQFGALPTFNYSDF